MRKIVMSGLVAAAALLGCAGPAFAGTGTTGTSGPVTAKYAASSAAARIVASYLGGPSAARRLDSSGILLGFGAGLSCASPTACLSVGTTFNDSASSASQTAKPDVARLHAGTWKSVPVKTPKGSVFTLLTGVSCKAATYCLVIGVTDSNSGPAPLALTWDGTTLTPIAAPPVPKADIGGMTTAVSCVAVRSCVAIGTGTNKATGDDVKFIWTLSGTKWALNTVPGANPNIETEYTNLHCLSLTSCVVAGYSIDFTGTDGTSSLVADSWNGRAFTDLKAPQPTGTADATFSSLSCVSAHSCVLVGEAGAATPATGSFGFAEVWNGATWKVTKWSGPKGDSAALFDVSCTSAVRCIAVGVHGTNKTGAPAALAWGGSKWTVLKVPGAGAGKTALFTGVSCPVNGKCVTTGQSGKTGAASSAVTPIAGYWNGTAWKYGPMFPAAAA